ncbi:MAG: hypothetical protein ACYDG3_04990, partial [Bacillati bacterium]
GERFEASVTAEELEQAVLRALHSLARGEGDHVLQSHAGVAFPDLASAVRAASSLWERSTLLFLLDDVSTRYLKQEVISEIISDLLFMDQICAFKLTTEMQTLDFALQSPGKQELAREGRDYKIFDLGWQVNERMRGASGRTFITDILEKRAAWARYHPAYGPKDILGDATLESIAEAIVAVDKTSGERKAVYHGVRALAAVCVGDIGDTISLYERILSSANSSEYPVPARIQTGAFLDYCSSKLYELNRSRGSIPKAYAMGFAEAAHDLLEDSVNEERRGNSKTRGNRSREKSAREYQERGLRQYNHIYIRVTSDEAFTRFARIRELIDAGVFVYHRGVPRTKTKDADPVLFFVLAYRKIFGLSHFIGLANRDRFELSGEELAVWLTDESKARDVLVRNLGLGPDPLGGMLELAQDEDQPEIVSPPGNREDAVKPPLLPFEPNVAEESPDAKEVMATFPVVSIDYVSGASLSDVQSAVLGLGFEARTLESARRWLDLIQPSSATTIGYSMTGGAEELIDQLIKRRVGTVHTLRYGTDSKAVIGKGPVLVDVTGLAKPIIFETVRLALQRDGVVYVCYTGAQKYYPLDEDIQPVLEKWRLDGDRYSLLSEMSTILAGEKGPYQAIQLMDNLRDPARPRVLVASASPKHERLLSFMDDHEYDRYEIISASGESPRSRFTTIVASVAQSSRPWVHVTPIDSGDACGVMSHIADLYNKLYIDEGFDFEFALTGSKMHAVALSALSTVRKIGQCWYLKPTKFDRNRFTTGVGETRFLKLEVGKAAGAG